MSAHIHNPPIPAKTIPPKESKNMKILNFDTAADDRPPQVVSAVDFTDNWPFIPPLVYLERCRHIQYSGDFNHPEIDSYQLDDEDPVLVTLDDGTYAVTSPEGLDAYLTRTGQTPTPPPEHLGTRPWVEANATPEPPAEPGPPATRVGGNLADAFAYAHTGPPFNPEDAARRTDLMPTSPADIQIRLNPEQAQRLKDEVAHATCRRCTTSLGKSDVYEYAAETYCQDCFEQVAIVK